MAMHVSLSIGLGHKQIYANIWQKTLTREDVWQRAVVQSAADSERSKGDI